MPQHKRGPWSQTEDQYLLHLVNVHGAHNWVRISSAIQTRSPKQCRERFHQNLKPNLNHDPISPEEGLMIEQMVSDMGKRWAEIARRLRGRSDNAVKNWWNGSMNRRRRSNNHRRTEFEVRQHPSSDGSIQTLAVPAHLHYALQGYSHHPILAHHDYGHPVYHPGQIPLPQPASVPSNAVTHRHPGMFDTPLPSPSAFSQSSADGAPSLVSDCSSVSARSPHNGFSPIELPPLSGARNERRNCSAQNLRLGVPGSFVVDTDFNVPPMPAKQAHHMLHEPFMHQQQYTFPQPNHYLVSQPRQPSPHQQSPLPQQYLLGQTPLLRGNRYPPQAEVPSSPASAVQLPSISKLSVSTHDAYIRSGIPIDPTLMQVHTPPVPSISTPDGSPRHKMSLSNLTH